MNQIGIFLDRDGTINYEIDFLRSPSDLQLIPGSAEAIKQANDLGLKVFVITNQSGIARGKITEENLTEIHNVLQSELRGHGASIDKFYYCPHHPDAGELPYRIKCNCRKPDIGMLIEAKNEFNIDLTKSFVIGDKMIDIQAGNKSGAKSILVLTGYGKNELSRCSEQNVIIDYIAKDLYEAMQFVKNTVEKEQLINS
jgi:D-glycero-D-manno-heptose 1,7-bisphosphate phosphatase